MFSVREKVVKVLLSLSLIFLFGSVAFAAPDPPAPAAPDAGAVAAGNSGDGADESEAVDSDTVETTPPGASVLPSTEKKIDECKILMNEVNMKPSEAKTAVADRGDFGDSTYLDILGCGIKTGDIRLWMIAYYIRFILEFIIGLSGLIAVGGIVYGGYLYLFAGISEDKDKGKTAIKYSVAGMILTLLAWAIVNIVISFVTI